MTVTTPPEHTESAPVMQPADILPPKKRPIALIAAAAGVVVLLAAAIAITAAVVGGDKSAKTPAGAKSIDVTGFIRLSDGWVHSQGGCAGHGGYSDIAEGAPVVVTDSGGKTIAIGKLQAGGASGSACTLHFDVYPVPAGLGFYGVEVSHRGRTQFKESELAGITLSLGS